VTVEVRINGEIGLFVEDDGPGIPLEARESVFDRFVRLPGSRGDGCGLGLAIVREIATLCRGMATIRDAVTGRGIRVEVAFPRGSNAAAGPSVGAEEAPPA